MTTSSVSNIFTILQQSYVTAGQNVSATPKSKYVPVDAKSYEGTWTGQYGNASKIRMAITNVSGYRATVRYQSGSTVVQQQVMIRDSSFHIGDSKFVLSGSGKGTLTTAVTDARTGNVSLQQASLTQLGSAADKSATGPASHPSSSPSAADISALLGKFA